MQFMTLAPALRAHACRQAYRCMCMRMRKCTQACMDMCMPGTMPVSMRLHVLMPMPMPVPRALLPAARKPAPIPCPRPWQCPWPRSCPCSYQCPCPCVCLCLNLCPCACLCSRPCACACLCLRPFERLNDDAGCGPGCCGLQAANVLMPRYTKHLTTKISWQLWKDKGGSARDPRPTSPGHCVGGRSVEWAYMQAAPLTPRHRFDIARAGRRARRRHSRGPSGASNTAERVCVFPVWLRCAAAGRGGARDPAVCDAKGLDAPSCRCTQSCRSSGWAREPGSQAPPGPSLSPPSLPLPASRNRHRVHNASRQRQAGRPGQRRVGSASSVPPRAPRWHEPGRPTGQNCVRRGRGLPACSGRPETRFEPPATPVPTTRPLAPREGRRDDAGSAAVATFLGASSGACPTAHEGGPIGGAQPPRPTQRRAWLRGTSNDTGSRRSPASHAAHHDNPLEEAGAAARRIRTDSSRGHAREAAPRPRRCRGGSVAAGEGGAPRSGRSAEQRASDSIAERRRFPS
eukprot:364051-Chlamydomonas_euryale.AAC.3